MIPYQPEWCHFYFVGNHSSVDISNQSTLVIRFFPNLHRPVESALYIHRVCANTQDSFIVHCLVFDL